MFDVITRNVVVAFQRHFRPDDISGIWDGECAARLEALLQVDNAGV
jgi:N-acetyl-anhydromuramyl-L-alanine amidase AmpD